jgi:BlaI family transcriptional regulator, penicillinase repressor
MRTARPPKEIPPPLEVECLKVLWGSGEATVKGVKDSLQPRRKLAYTTVMTLLERLVRKGGAARRKTGRAFVYRALLDQETVRRKAIDELTEALFDGSPDLLRRYLQASEETKGAAASSS